MTLIATVGASNANSYATAADGDFYFSTRLNADNWIAASTSTKESALITAAHRIDEERFVGYPASSTQSMRWPRAWATKQDPMLMYFDYGWGGDYYLPTEIPQKLKDAQCELALIYLNAPTTDPATPTGLENFKMLEIGPLKMEMNQPARASILPDEVARLLRGLRVSSGSLQRS